MSRIVICTILRAWLTTDWLVATLFVLLNDGLAKLLLWIFKLLISQRNEVILILCMVRPSWREWASAIDFAILQFKEMFHHCRRTSCYGVRNAMSCFRWGCTLIRWLLLTLLLRILVERFVLSFLWFIKRSRVQFRKYAMSHFIDGWILDLFFLWLFIIWLLVKFDCVVETFKRTARP